MSKVKLSEIANIIMGQSPSGETCNGIGDGIALLNGPAEFTSYYPVPKQYTIDGKKFSDKGDILFCVRGSTTGRMNWADQKYALGRGLASISHKNGKEYNHFLKFLLQSNLNSLLNAANGSTFPNLTSDILASFELSIPEEKTQKTISFFLQSIDSKIELNNRINAELEAMAKTLYDYWFVQFDFPDKNGKPYKTSGGKMVWNEELKREIPEGWEVKKINSIIEVKDGTHDSPKPKSVGYRLITSKNLQVSGLDFDNANLISEEDYLSIIKRSNVETGDILFSMIGNIGTIYKIEEKEINFAIKNVALYKTSQKEEYKNYIYMFLKSVDMDRYMKNVISGSIQKFIGLNSLRETPILSNEVFIKKYNEITYSIFEKLENLKLENQKLTELRDWLLPMLMNGQVKVSEL